VLLGEVRCVLERWAADSEFLASLQLPERVALVPDGFNAAAIGAALVGEAAAEDNPLVEPVETTA
jgi:hypothetical protein